MIELDRLQAAVSDRYRVEQEIGRGGMAIVYLAHDLKHDRRVAIKVLQPELASMVGPERFLREIQIEASLQHVNILPLHDSGRSEGLIYYVMPYVRGETLRDRLDKEKQLPLEEALGIAREIADALAYAHSCGIVHRDIKPANILLSEGHAILADFGIARAVETAGGTQVTESGYIVGTPHYMSPEQASGEVDLDGRSDLYALACVVYEMLAGEPPFSGRTAQAIIAKHMFEPPPSIQVLRPSVPLETDNAIKQAMAKTPADRFTATSDFVTALTPEAHKRRRPLRIWRELRFRLLAPITVAYLALAWLATKLGAGFVERGIIGDWVLPALLVALSIGIPVTVVIAWVGKVRSGQILGFLSTVVLVLVVGWFMLKQGIFGGGDLLRNRVVVFPLSVTPEDSAAVGEDVATLIGYALERTGLLTWIDGWYALDERQLAGFQSPSGRSAAATARSYNAAFYLLGRITFRPNSVRILLELHDVEGDSVVARGDAVGPSDKDWKQRELEEAVRPIIAALIPEGQLDTEATWTQSSQAIDQFVLGEREYRRARFRQALDHYRAAVEADSLFAIATIKGARAATWILEADVASSLLQVALKEVSSLTSLQAHFAKGLEAYLSGRADTAVNHFNQAFAIAPEWWIRAQLAEVYTHEFPRESPLDSLAESAFEEVYRNDPSFHPVIYHLVEIAARKGEVDRVRRLVEQYRETEPDSARLAATELMLRCLEETPEVVDWQQAVLLQPSAVYEAAEAFAAGGGQIECAEAGFRALLAYESTTTGSQGRYQFGSLLGLQSLLLAQGRHDEAKRLLEASVSRYGTIIEDIYLLNTVAGFDMREDVLQGAEEMRESFRNGETTSGLRLWFLGIWEAHEGRAQEAREVADSLAALSARSGARLDKLLSSSLEARAALAGGDTARAVELLQELTPTKPFGETWFSWESLGHEQLLLAELLYATGDHAEALRVAANLDAPARPTIDLLYLPASLVLRNRGARSLGDRRLEERCERRLTELGRGDLVQVGPPRWLVAPP